MAESPIYRDLQFPSPTAARPYVYVNMVATIDGKILSGERSDHVIDLGSKLDHALMDRLEGRADALLLGANSARANPSSWNPNCPRRMVATRSGDVPWDAQYFTSGEAFVVCPLDAEFVPPNHVTALRFGVGTVDWASALLHMRASMGLRTLHVMGGSELNAELLSANCVDELFLTIAPKVKLGRGVPTYAGGDSLPRTGLLAFHVVEHHVVDDEVFLRYRRAE